MKLLHVHSGNVFGGVERMLQAMSPAHAGRTPVHSSFALCFDGVVGSCLRDAGAEVRLLGEVHTRRPSEIRRARHLLGEMLQSGGWAAAVVHSAWSQAIFGPSVLKSGTPLLRWVHAPQPGPRWLEAWASRSRPSLVLCNSHYTQEGVGARFGHVPTAVQYPPTFAPETRRDARHLLRSEFGTPTDAVVVTLAARMEGGKGHGRLIDALAAIDDLPWEAWLAGGAQQPGEQATLDVLRADVASDGLSNRVRFLGHRSDVGDLLAASDIYCQPNDGPDSFGLSFVEAMSAGLPVVTSRIGAATEVLDPTCGLLVTPGSTPELTEALRWLITSSDNRQRMALAARARSARFCDLPRSMTTLAASLTPLASPSLAHT